MKRLWSSSSAMSALAMLFASGAGVWSVCSFLTLSGGLVAWGTPAALFVVGVLFHFRMRAIDSAYQARLR
jgi:hypothetical protein